MKLTSRHPIFIPALMMAGILAIASILLITAPAFQALTSKSPVVGKTVTTGTASIGGPFTLVASNGQTVTDQSYHSKWLLIYFGYTFCPDACPTALNNISVALGKLGSDAKNLQPAFITVDPQRDTRAVMADYLKSFDSRIVGLTGTQKQVDSVVKEYRVYAALEKSTTGGDDYLVSHSAYLYLMDPHGKFVNVIPGNEDGETITAWLRKEMARS